MIMKNDQIYSEDLAVFTRIVEPGLNFEWSYILHYEFIKLLYFT